MNHNNKPEFNFQKPAVYKIKVQGEIEKSWAGKLQGLQINIERSQSKNPVSVLVGQINDQSALSGIMHTLYDMHMTVISVHMLSEIEQD